LSATMTTTFDSLWQTASVNPPKVVTKTV